MENMSSPNYYSDLPVSSTLFVNIGSPHLGVLQWQGELGVYCIHLAMRTPIVNRF
jgi:hypothetical protein